MNIFKKKSYENYKDYLNDNNEALFAAWVYPEIFEITGISPKQFLKKKATVNKNVSLEDATKCIELMYNQPFIVAEIIKEFDKTVKLACQDIVKSGNTVNNGSFAYAQDTQINALIDIFTKVKDNFVKKELPNDARPVDIESAKSTMINYIPPIVSFWDYVVQSLSAVVTRNILESKSTAFLKK